VKARFKDSWKVSQNQKFLGLPLFGDLDRYDFGVEEASEFNDCFGVYSPHSEGDYIISPALFSIPSRYF